MRSGLGSFPPTQPQSSLDNQREPFDLRSLLHCARKRDSLTRLSLSRDRLALRLAWYNGSMHAAKKRAKNQSFWQICCAILGGIARGFRKDKIEQKNLRDTPPTVLIILGVLGIVFSWIPHNSFSFLHAYTFGMLFGAPAHALPVLFIALAIWLYNYPPTVRNNLHVFAGLFFGFLAAEGLAHLANPLPTSTFIMNEGGGL